MAKSGPFWIYNPSGEWSYGNSRLMENYFHVRFREHFFFVENSSFPFVFIPQRRIQHFLGPIYSISQAPNKTPLPFGLHISFDSIYVGT